MTYTRFKANKDILDGLVHLRKQTGSGGWGEINVGEPVSASDMVKPNAAHTTTTTPITFRSCSGDCETTPVLSA